MSRVRTRLERLERAAPARSNVSLWDVISGAVPFSQVPEAHMPELEELMARVPIEGDVPDTIAGELEAAARVLGSGATGLPADEPPATEPQADHLVNRPSGNRDGHA